MTNVEVKCKLKEYCRSRKLSLREVSRMSGLDRNVLYKRQNYTAKTIGVLLVTLGCKFEDLFEINEL